MGKTIWELDFYSRPVFDDSGKKKWEVLICESPLEIERSPDSLFRYSQFTDNQHVNSIWLREALESAIAQAPQAPDKIRFFRRQMNNMILKACGELDILASPSRRTYTLNQWLAERMEAVYPQEPGYDPKAAKGATVQYPATTAVRLPDALRGDKADKWALVSLEAAAFEEMSDWTIAFGEAFPLAMMGVTPEMRIPGLIIFSPRSQPLAAWMSDLELSFLQLEGGSRAKICLETAVSDSWILANITDSQTLAEAQGFEQAKQNAQGVHFLAVQATPDSESFAGFWLLKEP